MGDESRQEFQGYKDRLYRPPLATPPLARTTDRLTSQQAAAAIKPVLGDQQYEALEMVRRHPGCTTSELATIRAKETGEHWEAVSRRFGRRLSDLSKTDGSQPQYIAGRQPRRCQVSGRNATTWWAI